MVDQAALLAELKSILDGDSTMRTLTKVVGGDSKVIIGRELPEFSPPLVQIIMGTDNANRQTSQSEMVIQINAYSEGKTNGLEDTAEIEKILQRVKALLHDNQTTIVVGDHRVHAFYYEGRTDIFRDRENDGVFFGGILCRTHVVKTA